MAEKQPTESSRAASTGATGTLADSQEKYGRRPTGYRLPDATRLGRVELDVGNLSRSLAYYQHVIGLRVQERSSDHATLGAENDNAPLLELYECPGVLPVPRSGRLGLYHFAILLPDRTALGRFLAHLQEIGVQPGMSDHLVSEALYLRDPDGLGIEVYADRARSSWTHAAGELVMATKPLDSLDLIRAGRAAAWSSIPAGTRIGHIHLHVGDIDQAANFYHAAVGLDIMVWSYPGALFFSAGGYHHHLGTNTWAVGAPIAGDGDARLRTWEIVLPSPRDVLEATASIEHAGYSVSRVDSHSLVRDPWGSPLRIIANA
jgi:catechol 2,3-dioxygenase